MSSTGADTPNVASVAIRGSVGGFLMGLANLVPGISGGTMLLAAGIYAQFIGAVADVTTFKFRPRSLFVLGIIAVPAVISIGLLAGPVKGLVVENRWIMYSLFLGLTLGGVPVVWRLAQRVTPSLLTGFGVGMGLMVLMASSSTSGTGESTRLLLLVAGVAGASAMVLPGVSGAFLLMVLGQYERILEAVRQLKDAVTGDRSGLEHALAVLVPVAIGVAAGVIGVSNVIRWALTRHPMPTYGLLLGLLLGSVLGIYPFQRPLAPESHVLVTFAPTLGQVAASLALGTAGFLLTSLIDRLGGMLVQRSEGARSAG